jgi:hypothetical protein
MRGTYLGVRPLSWRSPRPKPSGAVTDNAVYVIYAPKVRSRNSECQFFTRATLDALTASSSLTGKRGIPSRNLTTQ